MYAIAVQQKIARSAVSGIFAVFTVHGASHLITPRDCPSSKGLG